MQDAPNLEDAARRWGVTPEGPPIKTYCSVIQYGMAGDMPVVLKALAPEADEARSGLALRHYGGRGAVAVLGEADGILLMPRILPGTDLTSLDDDAATAVFCDVARALHASEPPKSRFPAVEVWGEGFERHRRSGLPGIAAALLDEAETIFQQLAASQDAPVLLHGDLHHYNIVLDDRMGWVAIDPKGVIGEPAYEVGAFLRNPDDRVLDANPDVLKRRLDIMAERLGHDRQRMLAWHFAQAVLSAVWCLEDGENPAGALATAETARSLL